MTTIGELVRARAGDPRPGLRFEDSAWTWAEVVDAATQRAAFFRAHAPTNAPFHVGVLLDNVPEFWFTLCGAALAGATVVGINPTRRGAELAHDIAHTDCAFVLTETARLDLFEAAGADATAAVHVVDRPEWEATLAPFAGAAPPAVEVAPTDTFMLIFTSGTTGAPKAVRMGHARLAAYGGKLAEMFGLGPADVCYSVMPLFHSNAAVAGFANVLVVGRHGRAAAPVLGHEFPARRASATASRSSTTSASPSATSSRPRNAPTTPTTRCASRSATRPHRSTSIVSRDGSVVSSPTATAPPKVGST